MARKRSSINLSISAHEKAQLEKLALDFKQTWGDNPNVSKLIKAIANNKLRIAMNHDWSRERINILNKIFNWLKDEGNNNEALVIAQLLLERSEINQPLRQEIQAWVDRPSPPWRTELENCKRQNRPFRLTYQDAAERIWSFTVRYAVIDIHEERRYLDCWCDETEGNQDIDALKHNWSLRLDRIPDEEAVISPIDGPCQLELSYVDVEFHLHGRLALGYRTKKGEDLTNEWLAEQQVRRIVRRIRNTFWFFREIRRYGSECVIVGPEDVRDRFASDVEALYSNYFSNNDVAGVDSV